MFHACFLRFTAPYGIREKMEQVVAKTSKKSTAMTEGAVHFPSTSSYSIKRMFDDLLLFAGKHLKMGGRLVCWFPVVRDDYSKKILPQHSALELIENSEQKLNGEATRRLLTYEKVQESGEIINGGTEEMDFRERYFNQSEIPREERRIAIHQHNIIEAQKRGKTLESKYESRKLANKRIHLERKKSS